MRRTLPLLMWFGCSPRTPEVATDAASPTGPLPASTPPPATPVPTPQPDPCAATIEAPPAHFDPFYTQGIDANGIWVLASDDVDPDALYVAADIARTLLSERPDARDALIGLDVRFGIIGVDQVTTDLPEHAHLNELYPDYDWDGLTRGVGATFAVPLTSVGEENLLRLPGDWYAGESIGVHELSHSLLDLGIEVVEPGFTDEVEAAYEQAVINGWIADTYAATNAAEYWAEGVQSWFDANLEADPPDGIHGPVDTHDELWEADPTLASLIERAVPSAGWNPWRCVP